MELKIGKFNEDQFALNVFDLGKSLESYNFDLLYDLRSIMEKRTKVKFETSTEEKCSKLFSDTLHLFTRTSGTHSHWEQEGVSSEEDIKTYQRHNEKHYKLVFNWNLDYYSNYKEKKELSFVSIEEIPFECKIK